MSIEVVINECKSIEALLRQLGATGRGLHEKASSISELLNKPLLHKIRFMATVRNKLVHEADFSINEELTNHITRVSAHVKKDIQEIIEKAQYTPKTFITQRRKLTLASPVAQKIPLETPQANPSPDECSHAAISNTQEKSNNSEEILQTEEVKTEELFIMPQRNRRFRWWYHYSLAWGKVTLRRIRDSQEARETAASIATVVLALGIEWFIDEHL